MIQLITVFLGGDMKAKNLNIHTAWFVVGATGSVAIGRNLTPAGKQRQEAENHSARGRQDISDERSQRP